MRAARLLREAERQSARQPEREAQLRQSRMPLAEREV
jgi:hypothetical protein